ncbi:hypothetical protein NPIL_422441 [Nephila pilipes]|uniref:Uncharacterized protein n=1 Tax=Nephila pilipes TaxID=299642 RepID=A0A8X6QE13_NEPPI|nr:hypothetical protein NPIL_422441 [Nephila pilipes]
MYKEVGVVALTSRGTGKISLGEKGENVVKAVFSSVYKHNFFFQLAFCSRRRRTFCTFPIIDEEEMVICEDKNFFEKSSTYG